jgi:hypothetical protein
MMVEKSRQRYKQLGRYAADRSQVVIIMEGMRGSLKHVIE